MGFLVIVKYSFGMDGKDYTEKTLLTVDYK
jgi:hypothetical protein